ncbi:hypothetical protein [Caulobacter sp.]|uniref:hypothetical protein n=1 Tax=Caulobacter sp. TaxID=78 RepID=UPI001B28BCBE|nr:hypothetical protein [Caulobacter sp.]MBO9545348.1 hypothetical protein [Caulobacter sp.]
MAAPSTSWAQSEPAAGPETIAYTHRKPAAFALGQAIIPVQNNAGILGALAIVATHAAIARVAGAKAIERGDISDPAIALSHDLAQILAEQRDGNLAERPIAVDREKPKAIAKAAGDARYVVDVRTTNWDFRNEYGAQPKVAYAAEFSVIDGRTGKLVVQDNCFWTPPRIDANAMTATDPETPVRRYFAAASTACREQFRVAMRNLALAPRTTLAAASPVEVLRSPEPIYTPAEPVVAPAPPPAPVHLAEAKAPMLAAPIQAAPIIDSAPVRALPPEPVPAPMKLAQAEFAPWSQPTPERYPMFDQRLAAAYSEPTPAPTFVAQSSSRHAAGRDAQGYLTWPGKRP